MTTIELLHQQKDLRDSIAATNCIIGNSAQQLAKLIAQLKDVEDQLIITEVNEQVIIKVRQIGHTGTDASRGTSAP